MFCCKSSKKDTAKDQTNVAALAAAHQHQQPLNSSSPPPPPLQPQMQPSSQSPSTAAQPNDLHPTATSQSQRPYLGASQPRSSVPGPFAAYSHVGDTVTTRAPARPSSVSGQSVRSRISLAYRADGGESFDGRRSVVSGTGSTRSLGGQTPRKVVVMSGVLDMRVNPDHKSKRPSFVMRVLIQAMTPQMMHIRTLLLSGNTLDETSTMQLAHWISRNGTLDTLNVSSCRLGPMAGQLMRVICSGDLCRLRTVDLSFNKIDLHTVRSIAQAIGLPTSPIHHLIIHHNNITLEGVVDLLRCNCLVTLDVCADFATPTTELPFGIDGETWHRVTTAFEVSFRNLLNVMSANRSVTTLRFSRSAFNAGQIRLIQQTAARSPIGPSFQVLFTDSEQPAAAPPTPSYMAAGGGMNSTRTTRSPSATDYEVPAPQFYSPMHSQPAYSPMRSASPTHQSESYYDVNRGGGASSSSQYNMNDYSGYNPSPIYHNDQASSSVGHYPSTSAYGYPGGSPGYSPYAEGTGGGAGPSGYGGATYGGGYESDPYSQIHAAPWYSPPSPTAGLY